MFVGEQPGDQEDLAGRPFVARRGRSLTAPLVEVGIDRQTVYVTNAVKHFKFEPPRHPADSLEAFIAARLRRVSRGLKLKFNRFVPSGSFAWARRRPIASGAHFELLKSRKGHLR